MMKFQKWQVNAFMKFLTFLFRQGVISFREKKSKLLPIMLDIKTMCEMEKSDHGNSFPSCFMGENEISSMVQAP